MSGMQRAQRAEEGKRVATPTAQGGAPATQFTSDFIIKFHTLLKQRAAAPAGEEYDRLQQELDAMGGLEEYQRISLSGEVSSRFDSSIWVMEELTARHTGLGLRGVEGKQARPLLMLDVGAIRARYAAQDERGPPGLTMKVTSIDLLSTHPGVQQIDFFDFYAANSARETPVVFDVIVLSLVLNFVPVAEDRGRMLQCAQRMLSPRGLLFLVLPEPAVGNSRYLTGRLLRQMLRYVGLPVTDAERACKSTKKLFFCVCHRAEPAAGGDESKAAKALYKRVVCRSGGNRNNFCILLPSSARCGGDNDKPKSKEDGRARPSMTSNQRKKVRKRKMKEALKNEAEQ